MGGKLRRAVRWAQGLPVWWVVWLIIGVVSLALVMWLALFGPAFFVPTPSEAELRTIDAARRMELQNDVRATLLQGLGGLALLSGVFFTYRQLRIAREGQVTERFTRAVDQLGHDSLDVRLGGIFALERIAKDSSKDRATVAEVLTAFVRGHAPWPPNRPGQPPAETPPKELPHLQAWASDVHGALTVLCRRQPPTEWGQELDLADTDLRGADLRGAKLQGANLMRARLQQVNFARAQLQGAILVRADLQHAFLANAQLQGANLTGAQLQQAGLMQAQLQEASLVSADLRKADLTLAQLDGAKLSWAELQGAFLLKIFAV